MKKINLQKVILLLLCIAVFLLWIYKYSCEKETIVEIIHMKELERYDVHYFILNEAEDFKQFIDTFSMNNAYHDIKKKLEPGNMAILMIYLKSWRFDYTNFIGSGTSNFEKCGERDFENPKLCDMDKYLFGECIFIHNDSVINIHYNFFKNGEINNTIEFTEKIKIK